MKVQRIRLPENGRISWLVLDDDFRPVEPVRRYLRFREDLGRAPDTVRAEAHHLKLFWEYLRDERLDWTAIDVAHLAGFITWLRHPDPSVATTVPHAARRTDATIDQLLTAVHGFYDFHLRLGAVPDLPLHRFLAAPRSHYKPFLHGIAKAKPVRSRVVQVRRERRLPATLTRDEVARLLDACTRVRDRFLVHLLYDTGLRIGQALGLRHEDIAVEDGAIHVVPRDDNANGARALARAPYTVHPSPAVLDLYIRYLVEELDALAVEALPDYVFVNLWEGAVGQPLGATAMRSLFRRLTRKTGIAVAPHVLRHTRATEWLRDDGLPLATVSRLLGHASIITTNDTYIHLTAPDVRAHLDAARRRTVTPAAGMPDER